jgi:hypothetical protein
MDLVFLTLISILSRLVPHLPNMTTVGAMSIFSGAKLGGKKAWIITLVTLLVTDLVKGWHSTMWATYGAFLIAALIGKFVAKNGNAVKITGAVLFSGVLFFILTNFAVWLSPNYMYPKTWAGLMDCYLWLCRFSETP